MLRIAEQLGESDSVSLKVSGRLVENWVTDFVQSCQHHLSTQSRLTVNIDELTFVDQQGVAAVSRLEALGVIFVGGTAFVRQRLQLRQPQSIES